VVNVETGKKTTVTRMCRKMTANAAVPTEQNSKANKEPEAPITKKRVAAYCRVSKDIEQQESSYETQMATYKRIIAEHSDWELVKIYADRGISGTSVKARVEFNHMMEDAESGLIDLVLVKSISRFSRNTVDMLESVRHLKDIGVAVFFEKEKLDTQNLSSELLLTVYAAFAQEESHSISMNMKRGMRQNFKLGKPKLSRIYGYENTERCVIEVKPEEAEVVRRIFTLYNNGYSTVEISKILTDEKIPSPRESGTEWHSNTINGILHNEKYIGDCLMQKTVTVDHLTHAHTSDLNVDSYYKEDHHEAIVDRDMFANTQYSLYMSDLRNGISQYPYYGFLKCPKCGKPMVRTLIKGRTHPNAWICPGEGNETRWVDRNPCGDNMVRSYYIDMAVLQAIQSLKAEGHSEETDKVIRETQTAIENRPTVERFYLDRLVESITFPDWEHIKIEWKDKTIFSTVLTLHCEQPSEHPNPIIRNDCGRLIVGDMEINESRLEATRLAIARAKDVLKTTTIQFPKESAPIQIPTVKAEKRKKVEKGISLGSANMLPENLEDNEENNK